MDLNAATRLADSPAQTMERNYQVGDGAVGFYLYMFRAPSYRPVYWPDPTKPVYRSPLMYSQAEHTGFVHEKRLDSDAKVTLSYDFPLVLKQKLSCRSMKALIDTGK